MIILYHGAYCTAHYDLPVRSQHCPLLLQRFFTVFRSLQPGCAMRGICGFKHTQTRTHTNARARFSSLSLHSSDTFPSFLRENAVFGQEYNEKLQTKLQNMPGFSLTHHLQPNARGDTPLTFGARDRLRPK